MSTITWKPVVWKTRTSDLAKMRQRLDKQNDRVQILVDPKICEIKAKSQAGRDEFLFSLFEAPKERSPSQAFPGDCYRIKAFWLFPKNSKRPVGQLDYRVIKNRHLKAVIDSAHTTTEIFPVSYGIQVLPDARATFRGIGSSMFSIAASHVTAMGIKKIFFKGIPPESQKFFEQLSSRRQEFNDSRGSRDDDLFIDMEVFVDPAEIPDILVSLRSKPLQMPLGF
jgi:hypothetical protein